MTAGALDSGVTGKSDPQPAPAASRGGAGKPTSGWEVGRPLGTCSVCNLAIAPEQPFHAALRETPAGMVRVDACVEHAASLAGDDVLASWRTVMPRPEAKKKLLVDDEVLLSVFERLGDADELIKLQFRFVLGLILMRKRLLIYEGTRSEQKNEGPRKDIWTVRLKGRSDTLDLIDPHLSEDQIGQVSGQLGEILSSEL